ncbi:hypothetical protein B0180_09980 [Moraxella canis]|uniref:Uncharacterized protein n=1 Tax=Moraxella canis TaxID=90239 RepID=A0A1S9ZGR3_9GAMM|nr:hypothetical protein B0180_09980 [Moraxella canis]
MFGVGEKTDEQLADETEKTSKHVLDLERTLWTLIVRYKSRAYFLELVEKDYRTGTNYAFEFLEELAIIEYKRLLIDDT